MQQYGAELGSLRSKVFYIFKHTNIYKNIEAYLNTIWLMSTFLICCKASMAEELAKVVNSATEKIKGFTTQNRNLGGTIEQLQHKTSQLTQASKESDAEYQRGVRENQAFVSENESLKNELERVTAESKDLQHRNSALEAALDTFKGCLQTFFRLHVTK